MKNIPKDIKRIPEAIFIYFRGISSASFFPRNTPGAFTIKNANIAPKKIAKGSDKDADKAITESCVLSPNSAEDIIKKQFENIFRNLFFPS